MCVRFYKGSIEWDRACVCASEQGAARNSISTSWILSDPCTVPTSQGNGARSGPFPPPVQCGGGGVGGRGSGWPEKRHNFRVSNGTEGNPHTTMATLLPEIMTRRRNSITFLIYLFIYLFKGEHCLAGFVLMGSPGVKRMVMLTNIRTEIL